MPIRPFLAGQDFDRESIAEMSLAHEPCHVYSL